MQRARASERERQKKKKKIVKHCSQRRIKTTLFTDGNEYECFQTRIKQIILLMRCPYTRFYATELYENPLNKKGTLTERIFFLLFFFKLKNRQK